MKYIKDSILKLPKADVHTHFHLGGSQKKLLEKYPNASINFPEKYDGLVGMIDFIYGHLNKIMLTKRDVINFMEISIESSIDDNVTLLEASVDVGLSRFFDDSIEQVIAEVKRIQDKYKSKIDFKPDIGINKDLPLDKVFSYSEACMDSGVFSGIDIYGKEANQNLTPFQELYKNAKKYNLKTKAHIGEFSDNKSIEETIELLEPDEIQHGINAVNSDRTMEMIFERNIRLNICPQSNLSLGSVKNIGEHPIRKLFDKGIKVTVNTDDLILFNATVTDELHTLLEHKIFSFDEVNTIRENAFL
ncbi:MAG: adenosine deaminase [Ulvibacter sp.]